MNWNGLAIFSVVETKLNINNDVNIRVIIPLLVTMITDHTVDKRFYH